MQHAVEIIYDQNPCKRREKTPMEEIVTDKERKLARRILTAVENWQEAYEMVGPNVEFHPGIDSLVRTLRPLLFGTDAIELTPVNYDPVMADKYHLVPKDMKCHKCGADEPWKEPRGAEIKSMLDSLNK